MFDEKPEPFLTLAQCTFSLLALNNLARQFAGSQYAQSVRDVPDGYARIQRAPQGLMGNAPMPRENVANSRTSPGSHFAPVDMGVHFKTGDPSVGDRPALPGQRQTQQSDDTGSQGNGTAKTNEVQTCGVVLEQSAYAGIYHDEAMMRGVLPEESFVFVFMPKDNIDRERVVLHTVSQINGWLRNGTSPGAGS